MNGKKTPFEWERPYYPYHGKADGHTTALRRNLPENAYLGLEIEVNQKLATDTQQEIIATQLYSAFTQAVEVLTQSLLDDQCRQ